MNELMKWNNFVLICMGIAGLAGLSACAKSYTRWETYPSMNAPRQEMSVAEVAGKIYVVGGFDEEGQGLRTAEVYDPLLNRWQSIRSLPLPLHHAAAAEVEGRLYLMGGFEGSSFEIATDRVWEYNPRSDHWQMRAPMPSPRGALSVAVRDRKIYAVGGFRDGRSVNDHAVYHAIENRWEGLPPMPTRRDHLAAAAAGDIYAISGRKDGVNLSVVERFNPEQRLWLTAVSIPTARSGIAASVVAGRIYVFGGEGNTHRGDGIFKETEVYDPVREKWLKEKPMPTPRHGMGAALSGGVVYIPGGAIRQGLKATPIHEGFVVGIK